MTIDWSVFWINFLPALISGLVILGIGTLIAWYFSHSYQRRNDKKQMKNLLIDEIQELTFLLEEIESLWLKWIADKDNFEPWFETRLKTNIFYDKMNFIETKISNWFPNFAEIEAQLPVPKGVKFEGVETEEGKKNFESKEGQEMYYIFNFDNAVESVFKHCELLLDSLDEMETGDKISDELEITHENAINLMKLMLSTFIKEL